MRLKIALIGIVLLGGCVPSLHPLFTDKQVIEVPELVGNWAGKDGATLEFSQADIGYELIYTDPDGNAADFIAKPGWIEGKLYLNISPVRSTDQPCGNVAYNFHLVGAHSFWLVESVGLNFGLRAIVPRKFTELIEAEGDLIEYEVLEGREVLTASTEQLQQFIAKYSAQLFSAEAGGDFTRIEKD